MSDPTRAIAFDLLTAVTERHRPLEQALEALPATDARDRAAGHRLAASVLRRAGTLDAVLEPHLRRRPPEPVRTILRIGAAGLLLLGTPPHAAVATAVGLARARGLTPFAGLVNAVLRRVSEAGAATLAELDGPRLDTPGWLWASWGADARAIAEAHLTEAPLDVSTQEGIGDGEALPTGTVRFPPGTRLTELPGFAAGTLWAQDAGAALPARLLGVRVGERVADLCAAPGGKTAQLAATGANVVAVERDPARIARLRENLARLRLRADIVEADVTAWAPGPVFDAVLLDAPCSATGTIRRHPDVPHLKRPRDIPFLVDAQRALLAAAAAMLRPGGRLVYAVCSLQPDEAPDIAGLPLIPDPVRPDEVPGLTDAITSDGAVRTRPWMWAERGGIDGFFIRRFLAA